MNRRRFGECWELNQDWPGSDDQGRAVREALTPLYDSKFHQLTRRVDTEINRRGRHYLPVAFVPLNVLGLGFATGILLSDKLSTAPGIISGIVRHEFGHVYDQLDLLDQEQKQWFQRMISGQVGNWATEYQETWADAFRDWIASDGELWPELTPILLP